MTKTSEEHMISPIDLIYAQRFRTIFIQRNYAQKEVEALTGIPQRTISRLLDGKEKFTNEFIRNIVSGLKLELNSFTDSNETIHITDSPQSNNDSSTIIHNDKLLIDRALTSSEKTIATLEKVISDLVLSKKRKDDKLDSVIKENTELRDLIAIKDRTIEKNELLIAKLKTELLQKK